MTTIPTEEHIAPYRHVVSERAVSYAVRLLVEPSGENSVYLVTVTRRKPRSILALEGLGREVWSGVDPVEYVRGLRDEW